MSSMQTGKHTKEQTDQVFQFIVLLRLIATCLITNTHYNDVYPISALAVGGLLGDVLFFVVSGFCYGKGAKEKNFILWYLKRIVRIYPAIAVMSGINILIGYWDVTGKTLFEIFVFPTNYVFAASIMAIYIPVYFLGKVQSKKVITAVIGAVVAVWLIVFAVFMKKDVFFMQDTEHLSCQFLYMTAAFAGIYLRKFVDSSAIRKGTLASVVAFGLTFLCAMAYLVGTLLIRDNTSLYNYQIVTQLSVLLTIIALVFSFQLNEKYVRRLPEPLFKAVKFVADMTLEIYVVQRLIIDRLDSILFPLNWIIITASIIAAAWLLRKLCTPVCNGLNKGILKLQAIFER